MDLSVPRETVRQRRLTSRTWSLLRSWSAIRVNQATVARFEDGTAWLRRPEAVLMAYANALDGRAGLWLHGFVLWIDDEPVLDEGSRADIRERSGAWRRRRTLGRSIATASQRLPLTQSQRRKRRRAGSPLLARECRRHAGRRTRSTYPRA